MKTEQCHAKALKTLMKSQKIATLDELKNALGTNSKATVFRKLNQTDYRASYSHRGKYYTLIESKKFNEQGLWSFQNIHFSKQGTLLATAEVLVTLSDAGYYANELESILCVEVQNVLYQLVKNGRVYRERFANAYLYCASDPVNKGRQLKLRKSLESQPVAGGLPMGEIHDELKAAIILFFSLLDEQQRRLFAGLESLKWGYGGDRKVANLLGLDEGTVATGRRQLLQQDVEIDRSRKSGGGRKTVGKKRRKL